MFQGVSSYLAKGQHVIDIEIKIEIEADKTAKNEKPGNTITLASMQLNCRYKRVTATTTTITEDPMNIEQILKI